MLFAAVGALSALGGVVGGIFNSKASKKMAEQARYQAQLEYEARMAQLNFGKEIYSDWQNTFGALQTQVLDYYKTLTSDALKQQFTDANTSANNALYQQYLAQSKQLAQTFNKSGMANSGAAVAANLNLQTSLLSQKAQNSWQTAQLRANADNLLMGQKAQIAQMGQAQQQGALNIIANSYQGQAQSAAQAKNLYTQYQQAYNNNAFNSIMQGLGGATGALLQGFANNQAINNAAPASANTSLGGQANTLGNYLNNNKNSLSNHYFSSAWGNVG